MKNEDFCQIFPVAAELEKCYNDNGRAAAQLVNRKGATRCDTTDLTSRREVLLRQLSQFDDRQMQQLWELIDSGQCQTVFPALKDPAHQG